MLPANDVRRRARHSTLGWIALAENRARDAVNEFRRGDVGDCLTCVLPLVAMAQDAAGSVDSAIVTYEQYLGTRELLRNGDADFLAATYKRLGELYEARGDRQRAAGYYLKFVELWKNADAPLQPMVSEVRRRLSRLKDIEAPR
jgi:tetratricopeptide (TPR) repeat protein